VGSTTDNGNLLGLTSMYQTTDGASHSAADVWFLADKASATVPVVSPAGLAPALPEVIVSANTVGSASSIALRANVSALAQAIGSFTDSIATVGAPAAGVSLTPQSEVCAVNALSTATVVNMVDVMKQFDANGNPAGSQSVVSLTVAPGASGLVGQASNPAASALFVGSTK
jgi:hypothetical protein